MILGLIGIRLFAARRLEMSRVVYHHSDGSAEELELVNGDSLMHAAVANGVDGIVGECGGQLMCSTCHVYVRSEYLDKLPPISEDEEEMLECTAAPRDMSRSRLCCQLKDGQGFEVVEVDIPETQV